MFNFPTSIVTRQIITINVDGEAWKLAPVTIRGVMELEQYRKQDDYDGAVWMIALIGFACESADPAFEKDRIWKLNNEAIRQLVEVAAKLTYPPQNESDPKAQPTT